MLIPTRLTSPIKAHVEMDVTVQYNPCFVVLVVFFFFVYMYSTEGRQRETKTNLPLRLSCRHSISARPLTRNGAAAEWHPRELYSNDSNSP